MALGGLAWSRYNQHILGCGSLVSGLGMGEGATAGWDVRGGPCVAQGKVQLFLEGAA